MAEIVILGSGSPLADPHRAGSALAVVAGDEWILVDCGRAATQRAIDAGLDLTAVSAVALTHHHSDHLSDLPTFATTRWTAGATTPLTVVAPDGPAAHYARHCLDAYVDQAFYGQASPASGPRPTIAVQAFPPTDEPAMVYAGTAWRLSSARVAHHPIEPAVGYLVEHGGRRVAVSGDTAVCDGIRSLAAGAEAVVHQALLADRVSPSLLDWNASAREVGRLAAETAPGVLVLTHLIPAPTSPADERAYLDEIRAGGFQGTAVVAHDLQRIPLAER